MFFLRIACWNDSQMCPHRHIWRSKLMVGHLFVVFSPTLFLIDPNVFCAHFAMLAAPWRWKTPTGNLLKRFWQRVVKKHHPTSHLGVKTMQKRLRVSCKLTTWAPTQLSNLSFDVFWCVTMPPKSQKACPLHTNAPKSNANGFPQARKVVKLIANGYKVIKIWNPVKDSMDSMDVKSYRSWIPWLQCMS